MPTFGLASGAAAVLAVAVLAGCVNTDPAIFVDPTITGPTATVGAQVLGATLNGGFSLDLHLGARASGASTVTIGTFGLNEGSDPSTPILAALPGLSAQPSFPVTVQPNTTAVVDFTFSTGVDLLKAADETMICDSPGGLVVSGVLQDSLQDTSTPVVSPVFHATCPQK